MHRRKLRKYRILKDICAVVGGVAILVMAGSADSYSQNIISTAEFLLSFGIALDMMIVAYITHDCVKEREKHYLQMRELRRRHRLQGMKKRVHRDGNPRYALRKITNFIIKNSRRKSKWKALRLTNWKSKM